VDVARASSKGGHFVRGHQDLRQMSRSSALLSTAAIALVIVMGAGCGSSATSSASIAGLRVETRPHSSGPPICKSLSADVALRQLPAALSDLFVPEKASTVNLAIKRSVDELKQFGPTAPDGLSQPMAGAAAALEPLTSAPSSSKIQSVATTLEDLAARVQQVCHFSLS
jgi:hypothetical protein